jgi:hypothetical protein
MIKAICNKCGNNVDGYCFEYLKEARNVKACRHFVRIYVCRENFNNRDDKTQTLYEKRDNIHDSLEDGFYMLSDEFRD